LQTKYQTTSWFFKTGAVALVFVWGLTLSKKFFKLENTNKLTSKKYAN